MALELVVEGKNNQAEPLVFEVRRMLNGGLSNRDQASAQKHLDEILREGIKIKVDTTPLFFPKVHDRILTDATIEVLVDSKTCGEGEPVLLIAADEIYIGAGSDHSDRELEKQDLVISKQMCPNVISGKVWRYSEIKDHWDSIVLRSFAVAADGTKQLYQEGTLGAFMEVDAFLAKVKEHVADRDITGMAIYMGTLATLGGKLEYPPGFEVQLIDEALDRSLVCSYTLAPMAWFQ